MSVCYHQVSVSLANTITRDSVFYLSSSGRWRAIVARGKRFPTLLPLQHVAQTREEHTATFPKHPTMCMNHSNPTHHW